jgi:hypothetical protein
MHEAQGEEFVMDEDRHLALTLAHDTKGEMQISSVLARAEKYLAWLKGNGAKVVVGKNGEAKKEDWGSSAGERDWLMAVARDAATQAAAVTASVLAKAKGDGA